MSSPTARPLRERGRSNSAVASLAGLDPVIARIYASRGVSDMTDLDYGLNQLLLLL